MSDIFLSYASENRERVRPLVERLEEHGWDVWWDRDIPKGTDFSDVIDAAIADSRTMIVVWSTTSVSSKWVRGEAREGMENGRGLQPVRIEACKPPIDFRGLQETDLTEWDGSASYAEFEALIAALEGRLGKPKAKGTASSAQPAAPELAEDTDAPRPDVDPERDLTAVTESLTEKPASGSPDPSEPPEPEEEEPSSEQPSVASDPSATDPAIEAQPVVESEEASEPPHRSRVQSGDTPSGPPATAARIEKAEGTPVQPAAKGRSALLAGAAVVVVGIVGWGVSQMGGPEETAGTAEPGATEETAGTAEPEATVAIDSAGFRDCSGCPLMVFVRGGTFTMGLPAGDTLEWWMIASPQHDVTVPDFWVGVHEVTVGQWADFRAANPDATDGCGPADDHPVACVSWNDAQAYAAWLAQTTGHPYRLPTEAEWEYAARGGTSTPWFWGTDRDDVCQNANSVWNCGEDKYDTSSPVGSFPANAFGIHDTAGNVYEWTEDCWHSNYEGAPNDGSAWTNDCFTGARVLRGGSFNRNPESLDAADREIQRYPDNRHPHFGFRVVWSGVGGQD